MKLRTATVLLFALLAVMGTTSATTLTFNFTNSSPSAVWTSGPVSVTVTAYSLLQINGAQFQTATLGQYSGGLGVTNPADDSYPANQHTVDNADGRTDFILMQFSTPVDPTQLSINQFNTDSDLDYWTGNIPASLVGLTLSSLSGFNSGSDNTSGSRMVSLTSGAANALLVAADVNGGCNDFFKIAGLTVDYTTPPPSRVPEPATYATMGAALLGLGAATARRRKDS